MRQSLTQSMTKERRHEFTMSMRRGAPCMRRRWLCTSRLCDRDQLSPSCPPCAPHSYSKRFRRAPKLSTHCLDLVHQLLNSCSGRRDSPQFRRPPTDSGQMLADVGPIRPSICKRRPRPADVGQTWAQRDRKLANLDPHLPPLPNLAQIGHLWAKLDPTLAADGRSWPGFGHFLDGVCPFWPSFGNVRPTLSDSGQTCCGQAWSQTLTNSNQHCLTKFRPMLTMCCQMFARPAYIDPEQICYKFPPKHMNK